MAVFLNRRRLLALVDFAFQACRAGNPEPSSGCPQCRACQLHCPWPLRPPPTPAIHATDASSSWQAAVAGSLVARWRSSSFGMRCKKDRPPDMTCSTQLTPWRRAFIPTYKCLWRRDRVHINVAELEAYSREEARLAGRVTSARPLFCLDFGPQRFSGLCWLPACFRTSCSSHPPSILPTILPGSWRSGCPRCASRQRWAWLTAVPCAQRPCKICSRTHPPPAPRACPLRSRPVPPRRALPSPPVAAGEPVVRAFCCVRGELRLDLPGALGTRLVFWQAWSGPESGPIWRTMGVDV